MARKTCTDAEFKALYLQHGTAGTARLLGVSERSTRYRRLNLEKKDQLLFVNPNAIINNSLRLYPMRLPFEIENGIVLIGSDAHYWPGEASTAHRGLVYLAKEFAPELKLLALNGDAVDGARISRHPPTGWNRLPTFKEEKQAVDERTTELEDAAPKAERIWTLGNHDARFENKLAKDAGEMEGVQGFALKDQFPRWQIAISAWVNGHTVIKHRLKGGVHATHNNTVNAGKTVVTGHLHSLKVTPFTDYNGTRWGVDTGTLANPSGLFEADPQFDYNEDNPQNHRSGFAVLTFWRGRLLWPEIVAVCGKNEIEFRGRVIQLPLAS